MSIPHSDLKTDDLRDKGELRSNPPAKKQDESSIVNLDVKFVSGGLAIGYFIEDPYKYDYILLDTWAAVYLVRDKLNKLGYGEDYTGTPVQAKNIVNTAAERQKTILGGFLADATHDDLLDLIEGLQHQLLQYQLESFKRKRELQKS